MKEICANCKNSKPVDKATVEKSVKLQAIIAKMRKDPALKPGRNAKIAEFKASAEYADLMEVVGLDSLVKKSTDSEEGSVYIVCPDPQHLADEKAEKGIVHKYYFECPHFVANE